MMENEEWQAWLRTILAQPTDPHIEFEFDVDGRMFYTEQTRTEKQKEIGNGEV